MFKKSTIIQVIIVLLAIIAVPTLLYKLDFFTLRDVNEYVIKISLITTLFGIIELSRMCLNRLRASKPIYFWLVNLALLGLVGLIFYVLPRIFPEPSNAKAVLWFVFFFLGVMWLLGCYRKRKER